MPEGVTGSVTCAEAGRDRNVVSLHRIEAIGAGEDLEDPAGRVVLPDVGHELLPVGGAVAHGGIGKEGLPGFDVGQPADVVEVEVAAHDGVDLAGGYAGSGERSWKQASLSPRRRAVAHPGVDQNGAIPGTNQETADRDMYHAVRRQQILVGGEIETDVERLGQSADAVVEGQKVDFADAHSPTACPQAEGSDKGRFTQRNLSGDGCLRWATMSRSDATVRPPSVDALARSLARGDGRGRGLPHPLLVDVAREAIAAGDPDSAQGRAAALARALLQPVINGTGVLLHTNLGRAPLPGGSVDGAAGEGPSRASNLEIDLTSGRRGSRNGIGRPGDLLARLCGAEAALVVNNGAGAVLLVLAALAAGRRVAVSRGELVEIGGGFRIPEVLAQSGATLVEVGATNRTRLADYAAAVADGAAVVLKVHPSNYRITGFTESVGVAPLAAIDPLVPVVADLGSGLLDASCPWVTGGPPAWLVGEPAARQTLAAGAALVTFSGDKLLGGPQAGIIAGRADLVEVCARHPLARALRPGGLVLGSLADVALAYLSRDACTRIPFWRMATTPLPELRARAEALAGNTKDRNLVKTKRFSPDSAQVWRAEGVEVGGVGVEVVETEAVPGAGSAPGVTIPSVGVAIIGDHGAALRGAPIPILARVVDGQTIIDLRSIDPADDPLVDKALSALADGS